jgi:hypothetical protein
MAITRSLPLPIYSLDESIELPNTVPKVLQTKLSCRPHALSATTSRRRPRQEAQRGVRFAEYGEVFKIPHIDDLSDEEVESVWTSPEELNEIQNSARETASLIDSPNFGGALASRRRGQDGGICFRGLDQNTPSYVKKREATQNWIYDAVFRLQRLNWAQQDAHVHGMIADLCRRYSSPAVGAAIHVAKIDAREANV